MLAFALRSFSNVFVVHEGGGVTLAPVRSMNSFIRCSSAYEDYDVVAELGLVADDAVAAD